MNSNPKNQRHAANESIKRRNIMKKILSILFLAASIGCSAQLRYDAEGPRMMLPTLEREASPNYDVNNRDTYPIYRANHVVLREKSDGGVALERQHAIWCTREATYLAERIYCDSYTPTMYHPNNTAYIQDCATGVKYRQTGELGYPTNLGRYLVRGLYGTYVVNIEVYPPLPETCTSINYGIDALDDPRFPDAAKEWVTKDLKISDLQKNQRLMKYNPPTIVE